jgi:hypothetical protein
MSYYVGDSYSSFSLDTGISLTGASVTKILYKKPSGLKGSWNATATGTVLSYQLQNGDIDEAGLWSIQAYVEIGGKKAYGKESTIYFEKSLNQ